ncbi:MAG: hypothetical protein ACXW3Z_15685 [Limisphaerales bacterium]
MRVAILALGLVGFLSGCATCDRSAGRAFIHPQDGFAFANEMRWTYAFEEDGSTRMEDVTPPPTYSLRCFPMVRLAREFFYHARFAPDLPQATDAAYRKLSKEIIRRNSRCPAGEGERITIPGFADLHSFSAAYPGLLREECGGTWRSYFQRGNWRMLFPISDRRERKTARELVSEVQDGRLPIVHVYRFHQVRLNHSVMIYAAEETEGGVDFLAYDPNFTGRPTKLSFDAETDAFQLERNPYFAGGPVKVYQVYQGCCY